ncbi:MAG: hypothetical protein J7L69_02235 [Desulfobulbaceae bacterium]|nr:hypothetical protein [Desulfobulbaceae bacterium]
MTTALEIFMYRFFVSLLTFFILFSPAHVQSAPEETAAVQEESAVKEDKTLSMLSSLLELKAGMEKIIAEKKQKLKKSSSDSEKKELQEELAKLDKQVTDSGNNFERLATGIDLELFVEKKPEMFDWKKEISSLLKPGIQEIKRLTIRARQKTKLKENANYFQKLAPVAHDAGKNIESLLSQTTDKKLKKHLRELQPEWKNIAEMIDGKLELAQMELEKMESEDMSLVESSRNSVKNFFRTRGLYLLIAIAVFAAIFLVFRLIYQALIKVMPGYKAKHRSFPIRVWDLFFRLLAIVCAVVGLVIVLYAAEDWALLSLTIVFFLGVAWAVRQTIPKMWYQFRLMLNIGSVREGERLVLHGVPWLVQDINVYSTLENPALGVKLRLPIDELIGKNSRSVNKNEPWFPCKKNDWVILSDGSRGKVVSLSHEMVELVERGGAHKTYQTADFLALSPKNISINFRLKETFGFSYDLQQNCTDTIPETLQAFIGKKVEEEGYQDDLLNLRVEFQQAGASSLDLVVIADFKGTMAPLYNRLRRSIQRWCVDCSTTNNWEIPFPQLTVHKGQ